MANENETDNSEDTELAYRVPNLGEVDLEEKTFCIVQTDGQTTTVTGTRVVRPGDRDGALVVDDNLANEAGMDLSSEDRGDSFIVASIPNATMKIIYSKEHEAEENVEDDWGVDEEMEI